MTGEARAEFEEKHLALRAEIGAEIGGLATALRLRPERREVEAALGEKASAGEMERLLGGKASVSNEQALPSIPD